jgi:hypothetical protein
MTVMEECHRQIQDITGKQKEKVDELNAEIRKLKAMIGTSIIFLSSYLIPDYLKELLSIHNFFFFLSSIDLLFTLMLFVSFILFIFSSSFSVRRFCSFLFSFLQLFFLFIFPSFFYCGVFSETRDTDPVAGNQKQGAGEAAHVPGTNKIPVHSEPVLRIRDVYPEF